MGRVLAIGIAIVVALGAVRAEASGEGAVLEALSLAHVDGDHVVFVAADGADDHDDHTDHTDAKGSSGANGTVVHHGFTTYGDALALPAYEIRLVASSGIEQLRPPVTQAAAAAMAAGAPTLQVAPGTVAAGSRPSVGEVHVTVSSSSPCGGSWLGCGGPVIDEGTVVAGQIWISPRLLTRDDATIDNTTRHEVGHTLGLGHFDAAHEGRTQTMHPTSFAASVYESGDRAGFRFVSGATEADADPPASATARTPPPSGPGTGPSGHVELIAPGPFGVVVRGWATDSGAASPVSVLVTIDGAPVEVLANRPRPDGGTNGFEVAHPAPAGPHEVCVLVRDASGGPGSSLGCRTVTVSARSVGRVGLQIV